MGVYAYRRWDDKLLHQSQSLTRAAEPVHIYPVFMHWVIPNAGLTQDLPLECMTEVTTPATNEVLWVNSICL